MNKKLETLKYIHKKGILAVIRGENEQEAIRFSNACISGGIDIIEITFTIPKAINVLRNLISKLDGKVLIGAGTVLDEITARLAIMEGANFIVSPSFNENVAKICNLYRIPYIPGCLTPTEITNALEFGVDLIKVFPGSGFGVSYISNLRSPFPNINIIPTGGVDINNVYDWIKSGVYAVGVGGQLVKGTDEEIIQKSKKFIEKIKEARKQ